MDTLHSGTPRKRRRSETTDGGSIQAVSDEPIVHDETYYKENGDCVILVGRVLFKIHRILLEKDASAFSNMFSMPQGDQINQATTDEDPLVLYDDADDFRALCWIIYALPTVYMEQYKLHTANMQNLVSLYLIAQKYHFEAHVTFAQDLLRRHCIALLTKTSSGKNYIFTCPESRLKSLLRIATLTDSTPSTKSSSLSSALQNLWINRLQRTDEPVSFALGVAEALGLRKFIAQLYYLELTRMKLAHLEGSIAYAHPVNDLAPHQKLVLYQGCWSLRNYWAHTLKEFPQKKFDCLDRQHDCQAVWEQSWSICAELELRSEYFHPMETLGRMEDVLDEFALDENTENIGCTFTAIQNMQIELAQSFSDHFLGPLPASVPDA